MARKQCSFCGEFAPENAAICPRCREPFTVVVAHGSLESVGAKAQMRRGVLYVILAATLYYVLSSGYLGFDLPFNAIAILTGYLLPFLALCGAGLIVLSVFRRLTR